MKLRWQNCVARCTKCTEVSRPQPSKDALDEWLITHMRESHPELERTKVSFEITISGRIES